LFEHTFPDARRLRRLNAAASAAVARPLPLIPIIESEDVSKTIARNLLTDEGLAQHPTDGPDAECGKTIYCMGRVIRYIDSILRYGKASVDAAPSEPLSLWLYRIFTDAEAVHTERARMLEALVVACVDHGFTPPSTQACVLAASTRVPYAAALALSVAAISNVHGGASGQAAAFYADFLHRARSQDTGRSAILEELMREALSQGTRIPGLGHRVHTADPRCEALWRVAEETGVAAECVQASKTAPSTFARIRGEMLPINVDGVIGAIVTDMGLPPIAGTLVFVLGRVAGLSAHYFEEIRSFPAMRWINFEEAFYRRE
jgi:citrate synthase